MFFEVLLDEIFSPIGCSFSCLERLAGLVFLLIVVDGSIKVDLATPVELDAESEEVIFLS